MELFSTILLQLGFVTIALPLNRKIKKYSEKFAVICIFLAILTASYASNDDLTVVSNVIIGNVNEKNSFFLSLLKLLPDQVDKIIFIRFIAMLMFFTSYWLIEKLFRKRREYNRRLINPFPLLIVIFLPTIILYHTKQLFAFSLLSLAFSLLMTNYKKLKLTSISIIYDTVSLALFIAASLTHFLSLYATALGIILTTFKYMSIFRQFGTFSIKGSIIKIIVFSSFFITLVYLIFNAKELFYSLANYLPLTSGYILDTWADSFPPLISALYSLIIIVPVSVFCIRLAIRAARSKYKDMFALNPRSLIIACYLQISLCLMMSYVQYTTNYYAFARVKTCLYCPMTFIIILCYLVQFKPYFRKDLSIIYGLLLSLGAVSVVTI